MYKFYGIDRNSITHRIDEDYSSELVPGYGTDDMIRVNNHRNVNETRPIVQFDGPVDYFAQQVFNTRMNLI